MNRNYWTKWKQYWIENKKNKTGILRDSFFLWIFWIERICGFFGLAFLVVDFLDGDFFERYFFGYDFLSGIFFELFSAMIVVKQKATHVNYIQKTRKATITKTRKKITVLLPQLFFL